MACVKYMKFEFQCPLICSGTQSHSLFNVLFIIAFALKWQSEDLSTESKGL
jgi:hypothetical protein